MKTFERAAKQLQAVFMAVILIVLPLITAVGTPILAKAANGVTVKLHYHRADETYDDWSVWFWAEGKEGKDYAFAEEDGEMVATFDAAPGTTKIGFIVRTPDWGKDVDMDQFIELGDIVGGTVHVYVESQTEGYEMVQGEDVVTGIILGSATYQSSDSILISMSGAVEGELTDIFKLINEEGVVAVSEIKELKNNHFLIKTEQELDKTSSYSIIYDGLEYSVVMPIYYSTDEFEKEFTYTGNDLGATWSPEKTSFRVWAPVSQKVILNLYESGEEGTKDLLQSVEMTADVNGTWVCEVEGDLNGVYYTYTVTNKGKTQETVDPYARTTGVNGKRGMVIDLASTNPEGWDADSNPNAGLTINDAVIYESHVRDLTVDADAGIEHAGKFLGIAETGTKTASGISTGLDHLTDLGITHLHILPFYDFGSVDETVGHEDQYNWGYDPVNYNVPEGSYSTDPYHGEVRVKELKQMVMGLHEEGISVVMDVVYNHVQSASEFSMNVITPGYFSRISNEGVYSSGSGCGNDTASERSMVRKYIVDSVNYWADEYHIDGFRFDLVGLLDVDTVNEIVETVHETHPDVIFYGEGWTMDTKVTKEGVTLATQTNASMTPGFAYFNDNVRDSIKGNVFDASGKGFIQGGSGYEVQLIKGFSGSTSWCPSPSQTMNYSGCHDNNTLFDRLQLSRKDASFEDIAKMYKLSVAYVMTAQGVPFLMGGEEMFRTKVNEDGTFNGNSYNAGDEVNAIRYNSLDDAAYMTNYEYYKGMIAFRKAHPALRLTSAEEASKNVVNLADVPDGVIGFEIAGNAADEPAEAIVVYLNSEETEQKVTLPEGVWDVYAKEDVAGTEVLDTVKGEINIAAISALVLVKNSELSKAEEAADGTEATETTAEATEEATDTVTVETAEKAETSTGLIIGIIAGVVVLCGVVAGVIVSGKKKK